MAVIASCGVLVKVVEKGCGGGEVIVVDVYFDCVAAALKFWNFESDCVESGVRRGPLEDGFAVEVDKP